MLRRFALYGFLRNQLYFEPFWILAFREQGLSFFAIGLLFGFRAVCIHVLDLPGGAVADLYGRRASLILSWAAYLASFALFATSNHLAVLLVAMFFFAIGECLRTGTHKALVLQWLQLEGREKEKTKVFGDLRSWSKLGACASVIIATALVLWLDNYTVLFRAAFVAYVLGAINLLGYPAVLDQRRERRAGVRDIVGHLWRTVADTWRRPQARIVLIEAIGFQGVFKTCESYLQPAIQAMALVVAGTVALDEQRSTAIFVGLVYSMLHLASSFAARGSHYFAEKMGGQQRAAHGLWFGYLGLFVMMTLFFVKELKVAAMLLLATLHLVQNVWRPSIVSRIADQVNHEQLTSVLSFESQGRAAFVAIAAPALGLAVDHCGLWPVGAFGATIVAGFLLMSRRSWATEEQDVGAVGQTGVAAMGREPASDGRSSS